MEEQKQGKKDLTVKTNVNNYIMLNKEIIYGNNHIFI